MSESKLFRKVALDRLASPEQLDEMMRITTPKGWLALGALSALILVILLWGILGNIPVTVVGQGILTRSGALSAVNAPVSGKLTLLVDVGEVVARDQIVALIEAEGAPVNRLISPIAGRILRIFAERDAQVAQDAPLMNIESTDETTNPLEALVFVAPIDGARIQVGMEVQISPATVRREEHGYLIGTVVAVSETPASSQRITRLVGDEQFAAQVSADGAPTEVRIRLTTSDQTPSGYQWSSSSGPDFQLQSGTFTEAVIVIGDRRPISLILGAAPILIE